MACSSTDPRQLWIEHAERSLFALASELRRVPLDRSTKRLHVRALELKREMARWRDTPPEEDVVRATLEEIEAIARAARSSTAMDRARSRA